MVTKTRKEVVQEATEEESPLLQFNNNKAYIVKGEYKLRKQYSTENKKFYLVYEGENTTLLSGGSLVKKDVAEVSTRIASMMERGDLTKEEIALEIATIRVNLWAMKTETNSKSSNPTLEEIEA